MAENTKTLADFARSIGISPATARQWKRRRKIVERDGGFELDAGVTLGSVTLRSDHQRDSSVTVASQWEDVTQPESVTTAASVTSCRDCGEPIEPQSDWPICKPCHAKNPHTDCVAVLRQEMGVLRDRIFALETEVSFLRKKLGAPTLSQALGAASRTNSPIDPPSADWGA